jgi:hypothetical protein
MNFDDLKTFADKVIERMNWSLEGGTIFPDEYDRGYRDAILHSIVIVKEQLEEDKRKHDISSA